MAQPIIHHRTAPFNKAFNEVRSGLKALFGTKNDVLILASSGTGAMEAAVSNLLSPGEKDATINIPVPGAAGDFIKRNAGRLVVFAEPSLRLNVGKKSGLQAVSTTKAHQPYPHLSTMVNARQAFEYAAGKACSLARGPRVHTGLRVRRAGLEANDEGRRKHAVVRAC